jgi:hypothetical protein
MTNTRIKFLYFTPVVLCVCLFVGCAVSAYVSEEPEENANIVVPDWAPPYDGIHLVRYYYMPDIEVYYDVWNHDFAYLQDGTWMFMSSLPPMYAGYDLYNGYVVVLDNQVYEPWMHHHFYVAHYPRYYYHSMYNVTDTRDVRGFNENGGIEIRLKEEEKIKLDAASKSRPANEWKPAPIQEQAKPVLTRPVQRMKYYGPDIGKPVKVERQMMKPRDKTKKEK